MTNLQWLALLAVGELWLIAVLALRAAALARELRWWRQNYRRMRLARWMDRTGAGHE